MLDTHWADFGKNHLEATAAREADPYNCRPQGGESYAELAERTLGWLNERQLDPVVVSHSNISRALRGNLYNIVPVKLIELKVPKDKILLLITTR